MDQHLNIITFPKRWRYKHRSKKKGKKRKSPLRIDLLQKTSNKSAQMYY